MPPPPTPLARKAAIALVYAFETGDPKGKHGAIADVKGDRGGVSYGPWQASDDSGALDEVIGAYMDAGGVHADAFRVFLPALADPTEPLRGNAAFKDLLRKAATDPKMHQAQDCVFVRRYLLPAEAQAHDLGLSTPLGLAVSLDSRVHSGGILNFLRRRFPESPPSRGGIELAWLRAYLQARRAWLATAAPPLPNTVYRCDTLLALLAGGNATLTPPFAVRVGRGTTPSMWVDAATLAAIQT